VAGRSKRLSTAPRRRVLRALLRASLTSTVLIVLYYKLPLTGAVDASTLVLLLLGLAVFAGVISWQVRAILRSQYPALRAIEALAAAIPLFLLVFAAAYVKLADAQAHAFTEPLNRTDGLYFTVTVFSTVGFGDIAAVSPLARVLVTLQMVVGMLAVGLIARVVLGAVQVAEKRQGQERATPLG
jgi:voltage-gated potassium channel